MADPTSDYIEPLAELIVRFGANVQPDQIVGLMSAPGKEALTRAVAEAAYKAGAKFVDLDVFDVYLKRARVLHADPDSLAYVPPWYGQRVRALGDERAARIMLSGVVAPRALEDVDPALASRDMLPSIRESIEVVNARTTNWTIGCCPTPAWAELVHPELEPDAALTRLWEQVAHVCRLDEQDPVAAWESRFDELKRVAGRLDQLGLDALRFDGPGTELTVGLLQSSRWLCAEFSTIDGLPHRPNLPTEEVFTTPDPERTSGVVSSTKPLFTSGKLITGIRVEFDQGRAVSIDAEEGAETLRGLSQRDPGANRLGEVALVDREGRIGPLDTVFYDTLLDENAASHIALGQGIEFVVDAPDVARINSSEIHIDFMIGADDVEVTGIGRDGAETPLLRGGSWQV